MHQLVQKLGNGKMFVLDVPTPAMGSMEILIEVKYSFISSGTESSTVKAARMSYINKAKARPDQAIAVLKSLFDRGISETFRAVWKRLDAYSPLGYSISGIVVDVGSEVKNYKIGDRVVAAGLNYAVHAGMVSVPHNLVAKMPDNVDFKSASINAIGSIALQGIKQANLNEKSVVLVVGLGLIGTLTKRILQLQGHRCLGFDIKKSRIENLKNLGEKNIFYDQNELTSTLSNISSRLSDSVIVCASSKSASPLNLAAKLVKRNARIVLVGDVNTGFDRNPNWYKKELELIMSCSYGPGRYDINFEELGMLNDEYKWNEKDNFIEFQNYLSNGLVVSDMIYDDINIEDSPKIFDKILKKPDDILGAVINYKKTEINQTMKNLFFKKTLKKKLSTSMVGLGNYALGNLVPHISNLFSIEAVMSKNGSSATRVAEKNNVQLVTTNINDIIGLKSDIVFIATRHDTHAKYINDLLSNNLNVFVEKPIAINIDELNTIEKILSKTQKNLFVGYNRRFSSHTSKIKSLIKQGPKYIKYSINAGFVDKNHWSQNIKIGGGRLIGEVCHFVDLSSYLIEDSPSSFSIDTIKNTQNICDIISLRLKYNDGSLVNISYYSNGPKGFPKEHISIIQNENEFQIEDFKKSYHLYNGKRKILSKKLDKGQKNMINYIADCLDKNISDPMNIKSIIKDMKILFQASDSIK